MRLKKKLEEEEEKLVQAEIRKREAEAIEELRIEEKREKERKQEELLLVPNKLDVEQKEGNRLTAIIEKTEGEIDNLIASLVTPPRATINSLNNIDETPIPSGSQKNIILQIPTKTVIYTEEEELLLQEQAKLLLAKKESKRINTSLEISSSKMPPKVGFVVKSTLENSEREKLHEDSIVNNTEKTKLTEIQNIQSEIVDIKKKF